MYKKDDCLAVDSSPHSPHTIIPILINSNTEILDVGCNTGFLGKAVKKKGVVVDGIDINDSALKIAKKYYRKLYKRDLYKGTLNIDHSLYDYIIFADILEHLPRPDLILSDCKKYLKKNGGVIISLPNIARAELRIKHLLGNFDYEPGIMGEDHLRFYTRKSAAQLIEHCGFEIEDIIPTGLGHRIKLFSTLTAFQFIFVCRSGD